MKVGSSRAEQMILGRRRFIGITAFMGLGLTGDSKVWARETEFHTWQGQALGADASLRIYHPDASVARTLIRRSVDEVRRLEQIFSLYRSDSALSALNRDGRIEGPPLDLVQLLSEAHRYSNLTDGAFDITVQPLWRLYADHFTEETANPMGPSLKAIADALARVDFTAVSVTSHQIAFEKPGMAITLNGIAQGFITDRVAEMLREQGMENVLIDLGEMRALGDHPKGRPWQIGLKNPQSSTELGATVNLSNRALATSAGSGTRFSKDGRHHHLLDPRTGQSSSQYLSLSVSAPTATEADALSTGLYHLDEAQTDAVLQQSPQTEVRVTLKNGAIHKKNWTLS